MANAQKPRKHTIYMDVQTFSVQNWVNVILLLSTASTHLATKLLVRTLFYRHDDYIMGRVLPEYTSTMLQPVISHMVARATTCILFVHTLLKRFGHSPPLTVS